ncbi:uncharacterized protein LOC124131019 isoform X3 [Haliotis rufescens]|uniref:uncharacterized protein LOC124131019 isoform X3 n=1 Tax=Haliotis rufescens TaxID=6454 RepID=UPI00201EF1AA|nr:uncharacterized protein LOC124131019 isoform X3 [Haliotis rufescens]
MRYLLFSALLLAALGACSAFTVDINGGRVRMRREAEDAGDETGTGSGSVESQSTGDTAASDTSETESSDKTAETESTDTTAETGSADKTAETESTEKSAETESTDKTAESESADKTAETESTEKSAETESTDKTAESESADKTAETESTDKSAETESADKTAETESTNKTAESESADKTAETENTETTESGGEGAAASSAGSAAPESPEAKLEVAVKEDDPSASSSKETKEEKLPKSETVKTEEAGEDDTGKADPVEEAGKGKGASGDGSGLAEEEDEPTAVNENGVINYRPANTETVASKETNTETKVQAQELSKLMTGEDLEDPKGGDEDGDRNEDEDKKTDEEDSSSGGSAEAEKGQVVAESDDGAATSAAGSSAETTDDVNVVAESDEGDETGKSGEGEKKADTSAESDKGDSSGGEVNLSVESGDNTEGDSSESTSETSGTEESAAATETTETDASGTEESAAATETTETDASGTGESAAATETTDTDASGTEESAATTGTTETDASGTGESAAATETTESDASGTGESAAATETTDTDASGTEESAATTETTDTDASGTEESAATTETTETDASGTDSGSDSDTSSLTAETDEPDTSEPETSDASKEEDDDDDDDDDESDDDESSKTSGKRRRKRLALSNPKYKWPKAIFPFKFQEELAPKIKLEATAAMGYLTRHTCMEFVPYEGPQTNEELELNHRGHLIFDNYGGCWSYVGLMDRKRGQTVSCMSRSVFIHEIGHSAFLVHEQNGDNRKGLIRINYDNIQDALKDQYIQLPSSQTLNYTGYDVSSLIHYPIGMNSKNGKQTMSILYEAPDFHVGGHLYYVAAELNIGYDCKEKSCPDFATKCVKDSYVVKRDGKCRCECTRGVDSESGCAEPKKAPSKVAGWGPGKLSMLKPKDGCPEGMKERVIEHEGDAAGSASSVFHMAAEMGAKSTLPLCVSEGGEGKWPMGRYCLINEKDSCPKGFESGSFTLGQKSGDNTVLNFCCKDDGFNFEEIPIKNEKPFTLFRLHKSCQNVEDMYTYEERITLDSNTKIVAEGKTPVSQIRGTDHALSLFVCYYVPLKYGCGKAIDLTPENPTGSLSTPNYPQNYPKSTECTWLVTGSEKDSVIVIDFDDKTFCLASGDHVDVHYNKIGQPSLRNTGKGYKPSVVTLYNNVKIQFRSDLETECSGFTAKVRMVTKEEQAFNVNDEGKSYRGTIDFTHNTIPCLPWREMSECPHHPFAPGDYGDGLESNYCRNPGDGIAPWCYVSHDNCERNYCDVSLIGRPADNFPDCAELIAANSDFCKDQTQAVRGCFKSCLSDIKYDNKPKKVTEVTCPKPDAIDGAEIVDAKDSYKMGEKAVYECTSGEGDLTRTCTSNGDWTPGGYVCGDCPTDWIPHQGYCYHFFDIPSSYAEAEDTCHSYDAFVVAIKSKEESDFLEKISRPTSPQWLGMKRKGNSRTDYEWDMDKTLVGANGYSNWYKGTPHHNKKRKNAYCRGSNQQMTWRAQRSKSHKPFFPFTCQKAIPENIPCVDRLPNCEAVVVETPEVCQNYTESGWGEQQCRKTCGACGDTAECTVPAAGGHAELLTTGSVHTGEVAYYECEEGYTVSKGSLIMACLPSGKMTSEAPECVEKGSVIRPSNNNDIRPRGGTFGCYVSFTGNDDMYVIDAPGKVIAWEFYLLFAGTTVFQIWRPTDDPAVLTLVGQNSISAKAVRPHVVNIPAGEQIEVEAGDRIGVYNPYERAGIAYDTNKAQGDGSLKLASNVWYASDFVVNNDYEFKASSPLRIMSFRAILGPK